MTDFAPRDHPRYDPGLYAGKALGAALGLVMALLPMSAHADGWSEFHTRCLTALEALAPPVVAGLGQGEAANGSLSYDLPKGGQLLVEESPPDGLSACSVTDPTGASEAGFDTWIAEAVATGRYIPAEADTWHSNQWIEPVLALQKRHDDGNLTLRIVETHLEA
ncbi:hypothetical protein SAMN05443999_10686 [Roseovarius azorensis]|uniref:Uncharacterized protein n=1 Tax=Roseovarius azorensis TaxID=1287727 RepID=A0A1H7R770_9RHOB|nr:hypothetical protein [Roseovarius azorensis]SEL56096.1 hypothetical protein SAMN05443999_10686 [Roseovarius azorensis]